jgi:hypothetical protein
VHCVCGALSGVAVAAHRVTAEHDVTVESDQRLHASGWRRCFQCARSDWEVVTEIPLRFYPSHCRF